MSTIVWVMVIYLNSAFSAEQVSLGFDTEQACEDARKRVLTEQRTECQPTKKKASK